MASFVVDEDLHVALAEALRNVGHEAIAIREAGLQGANDREVFAFAQQRNAILITADLDFSNVLDYPLGTHAGIIVLRIPDTLSYTVYIDRYFKSLNPCRFSLDPR